MVLDYQKDRGVGQLKVIVYHMYRQRASIR